VGKNTCPWMSVKLGHDSSEGWEVELGVTGNKYWEWDVENFSKEFRGDQVFISWRQGREGGQQDESDGGDGVKTT
jgi:hypothetical protein